MSFTAGNPKKPVPPKCAECGKSKPMPVLREGIEKPDDQGGLYSHEWLCGDCLYKRDHPNAEPAKKLPRERSKRLQKETLW